MTKSKRLTGLGCIALLLGLQGVHAHRLKFVSADAFDSECTNPAEEFHPQFMNEDDELIRTHLSTTKELQGLESTIKSEMGGIHPVQSKRASNHRNFHPNTYDKYQ